MFANRKVQRPWHSRFTYPKSACDRFAPSPKNASSPALEFRSGPDGFQRLAPFSVDFDAAPSSTVPSSARKAIKLTPASWKNASSAPESARSRSEHKRRPPVSGSGQRSEEETLASIERCRRGDLNKPPPTRIQRHPAVTSVPERHPVTSQSAPYRLMPLQDARCH